MKPLDRVYWMRVLLGVAAGVLASYLSVFRGAPPSSGFILALAFYTSSYYLSRYVVATDLPVPESKKWFTTGLGSFIILWLWSWIFIFTLFA